jgi:hypothetical protein
MRLAVPRLSSFLIKGRGYYYPKRKENGHGKIARSDEEGFGVKELQS